MKEQLLKVAMKLAARDGLERVTRDAIANEAEVSAGSVSYHFGDMRKLRATIVQHAVDKENLDVLAQALALRHPRALAAPDQLKSRAIRSLMR